LDLTESARYPGRDSLDLIARDECHRRNGRCDNHHIESRVGELLGSDRLRSTPVFHNEIAGRETLDRAAAVGHANFESYD
jgi:hypothetical protein